MQSQNYTSICLVIFVKNEENLPVVNSAVSLTNKIEKCIEF